MDRSALRPVPQGLDPLRPDPKALDPDLVARVASPALVVDLAAARRNIRAVLGAVGGPGRWRPHVKTTKLPSVLGLLIGEGLRHFKCATVREARVLCETLEQADVPAADVLVAHHLHGPSLGRLAALARTHRAVRLSCLVECPEQAQTVGDELGLFVDIDSGMGRTGVPIDDKARILATARAAGERLLGVHAYDGHRHEPDTDERRAAVYTDADRLLTVLDALRAAGSPAQELVTAGTPAFPAAAEHPGYRALAHTAHRVSPGTVVYHDLRSMAQLPGLRAEPAVTVLARVASVRPDGFTVDAGSKAVEAADAALIAVALERPGARALRQSEEHTVFDATGGLPARGEALRVVPGHVCPTVNHFETALVVEDGRFLGVEQVAARGHDAPLNHARS